MNFIKSRLLHFVRNDEKKQPLNDDCLNIKYKKHYIKIKNIMKY